MGDAEVAPGEAEVLEGLQGPNLLAKDKRLITSHGTQKVIIMHQDAADCHRYLPTTEYGTNFSLS